jgi:hypothetical protein
MSGTKAQYPCPCCGFLVFDEEPGSFSICPICDADAFAGSEQISGRDLVLSERDAVRDGKSRRRLFG